MSDKLCLKWSDFQENITTSFDGLRNDTDFSDVTLACEDGEQFEAHKVILAASSPFFQNLLRNNKHPHPLIYLKGCKSEDLVAIIDILYCGEENIFQENLEVFMATAEELKVKVSQVQSVKMIRRSSLTILLLHCDASSIRFHT